MFEKSTCLLTSNDGETFLGEKSCVIIFHSFHLKAKNNNNKETHKLLAYAFEPLLHRSD